MDHIPLPLHPIRERFKIPLLSLQDYNNPGDFLEYPEHQGWTPRPHWEWNLLFQNPPPEFQAFLQRWLCFGLLDAVLDCDVNVQDFAQQEPDGEYYFSTRHLVEFAEKSFKLEAALPLANAVMLVLHTATIEFGSYTFLIEPQDPNAMQSLEEIIRRGQMPMMLDPRVAVGLIIVADFLFTFGTDYVYKRDPSMVVARSYGPATASGLLTPPLKSTIWRLMREDGWCPYQLSLMFSSFNISGLLFMLHLQGPAPLEKHNVIRVRKREVDERGEKGQDGQKLCTTYSCGHRVLENSTYVTRHCSGCQGCQSIVADIDQISDIIMSGSFPLILSIEEQDYPDKISLVPWDENASYIAISHVWSDGLGNVQDNSLPLCQLRRLSRMVREVDGRVSNVSLFWLDTICVPRFNGPKSPEQKAIRTKALEGMRKIYSDTAAALVLDSWLLSTAVKGMSAAEILMRAFSCAWNTRLWTYQEAALPIAVYFQFQDMALDTEQLYSKLTKSLDTGQAYTLERRLSRQYLALRGFRLHYLEGVQLACIIDAMSYRTTTVSSDEAICLSTLLGLDTAAIVNTAPDERMQKFWMMLSEVPNVVLESNGPKLDAPGLSWAPRSLLLTKECVSRHNGQLATLRGKNYTNSFEVTAEGLRMKAYAMIINCGTFRMGRSFHLRDQHGSWYSMQANWDDHVETLETYAPKLQSIEPSRIFGGTKVALLLNFHPLESPTGLLSSIGSGGTMIAIKECLEGVHFGKVVGSATFTQVNESMSAMLKGIYPFEDSEDPWFGFDRRYKNLVVLTTSEMVDNEMDWCIV